MSTTQTNVFRASWMDTVLDGLRSPGAMMVALMLALFPQGEHTAQVFLYFSHDHSSNAQFFAYAFAAAVEVAVLLFVLAGHKRISYMFAGASFLTNVVYYAIGGAALLTVSVFPVLLLSALLPACIMGYSHTIAEKPKNGAEQPVKANRMPARRWWRFGKQPLETLTTSNESIEASSVDSVASCGHGDGENGKTEIAQSPTKLPKTAQTPDPAPTVPTIDARTQALQLRDEGYTAAEIARMTGAKYSTVQSWLRRATVQTNGATQQ